MGRRHDDKWELRESGGRAAREKVFSYISAYINKDNLHATRSVVDNCTANWLRASLDHRFRLFTSFRRSLLFFFACSVYHLVRLRDGSRRSDRLSEHVPFHFSLSLSPHQREQKKGERSLPLLKRGRLKSITHLSRAHPAHNKND